MPGAVSVVPGRRGRPRRHLRGPRHAHRERRLPAARRRDRQEVGHAQVNDPSDEAGAQLQARSRRPAPAATRDGRRRPERCDLRPPQGRRRALRQVRAGARRPSRPATISRPSSRAPGSGSRPRTGAEARHARHVGPGQPASRRTRSRRPSTGPRVRAGSGTAAYTFARLRRHRQAAGPPGPWSDVLGARSAIRVNDGHKHADGNRAYIYDVFANVYCAARPTVALVDDAGVARHDDVVPGAHGDLLGPRRGLAGQQRPAGPHRARLRAEAVRQRPSTPPPGSTPRRRRRRGRRRASRPPSTTATARRRRARP